MDALTKKKTDRFRFLNRLYEKTDGHKLALESMWNIGTELGLSRDETDKAVDYLVGEGLATHRAIGGAIAMTHAGVLEVERALAKPEAATEYFPPVMNIMNIQSIVGSQIQQGTHASSQTQSVSQNDMEAIRTLVDGFKASLSQFSLREEDRREAEAELQTVEAQLRSGRPKLTILRESLATLRNLLEGVASNALAAGLLPLFAPLAATLGF